MSESEGGHFDFIVVSTRTGIDRATLEIDLVNKLGAKPEKAALLLDHIATKGAVAIEKSVSAARLEELKQKWEAAGFVTTSERVLGIIEGPISGSGVSKLACPSCGHKLEQIVDDEKCPNCGVFPKKFAEQQRKKDLIRKERERLEQIHGIAKRREEQDARNAAEQAELEEIRRKLEEEMGLKKPKGFLAWLNGGGAAGSPSKPMIAVLAVAALLAGGLLWKEFQTPQGPTPEMVAKQQAAQTKQAENQMQKAVGQMVVGSKKMAQASGAAEQFSKEIFSGQGVDAELDEQVQAVETRNTAVKGMVNEGERAEGVSQAARQFSEAGGSVDEMERALGTSMQSARDIKDDGRRTAAVSAVAGAQFEIHTADARKKMSEGDWRAADKSFSKAMSAATDISSKSDAVSLRATVAKARAETGDFGGAALLFLDAIKAAEEIPNLRERAQALADVGKSIAETSNDLSAAERAFDKALAVANAIRPDRDKIQAVNSVLYRRVQAAGNIGGFLISVKGSAATLKETLDLATKDAMQIMDPVLRAYALGIVARTTSESGDATGVTGILAKIDSLATEVPEALAEFLSVVVARAKAETLAAAAKFKAGQGERKGAKQGFLDALKAANGLATKSTDPRALTDVAKERSDALSTVARYMQAAGDKKAAERVFKLATLTTAAK